MGRQGNGAAVHVAGQRKGARRRGGGHAAHWLPSRVALAAPKEKSGFCSTIMGRFMRASIVTGAAHTTKLKSCTETIESTSWRGMVL